MSELTARLESQMRALQLRAILNCYRELSDKAAQSNLGYEEYLSLLQEEELRGKIECSVKAKIQKARLPGDAIPFPYVKTLEAFDFSFQPGLRDMEILALSSLEFIENKGNLIFLGPPGVGKTHLAVALGIKACQSRHRVLFMPGTTFRLIPVVPTEPGSLPGVVTTVSVSVVLELCSSLFSYPSGVSGSPPKTNSKILKIQNRICFRKYTRFGISSILRKIFPGKNIIPGDNLRNY